MLKSLWERYILWQSLKKVILFALAFFSIYALIDYSINAKQFSNQEGIGYREISLYYFYLFIKRLHLILLLGLTLSTVTILLTMNEKRELLALFCAGLSKKKLISPFLFCALCISLVMIANFQFGLPKALDYLEEFELHHLKSSKKKGFKKQATYALTTKQQGRVIFSNMDPLTHALYDVYLILSIDEFWKITKLETDNSMAVAYGAEHFLRDHSQRFTLIEKVPIKKFYPLEIDFVIKKKGQSSYEGYSLSNLVSLSSLKFIRLSKEEQKILTQCIYKISVSFLSFLIIIACACFCLVFSRKLPIFMIYAMSILGAMTFIAILDAGVILAEGQILSPWSGIVIPLLLGYSVFYPKFLISCKN